MANQPQPQISFEAPLYRPPSEHLRNFMEKLIQKPVPCHGIWREEQKLTFYMSQSEKATISPFPRKTEKTEYVVNKVKAFASKFNVTNIAVIKGEANMNFELLSREDLAEKGEKLDPNYGDGVVYVMRVRVTCNSDEATRVLLNFYGILDISIEPLFFDLQLQEWPQKDFWEFKEHLEQSKIPCYVEVRKSKGVVLTTEEPVKNSISIPISISKENQERVTKRLSIFTSKFNATSAFIAKKQAHITIDILDLGRNFEYPDCDEETICIMRVRVTCTEAEARNVLGDFFKMLDKYGN